MGNTNDLVKPGRDATDGLFRFATAIIFLLLPFSEALPGLAATAWSVSVFGVIFAVAVLGKLQRPVGQMVWLTAAYLAVIGVVSSSIHADSLAGHMLIGAQVVFFIALGPYALRYLAAVPGLQSAAAGALLAGQTVSALAAIIQASGTSVLGAKVLYGRAPGLAGHPNVVGVLSSVAIVVFLHLIFKSNRRKVLWMLGLIVNIGALLASGSISSLIACSVGVLVFMSAARVSVRVPLLITGGAAAALWGIGQMGQAGIMRGPYERFLQVTGQTSAESTLDIRQNTYAYAWERIQTDPLFGRGLDYSSGATFDNVTLTHNVLLRAWFQGGLALGLAFAIIYCLIIGLAIHAIVRGVDAVIVGVMAVLVGFSLTSAALQQGYFWLLIIGALSLIERSTSAAPEVAESKLLATL